MKQVVSFGGIMMRFAAARQDGQADEERRQNEECGRQEAGFAMLL